MTRHEAILLSTIDLLEEEAQSIKETHTKDDDWGDEDAAREAHDECLELAAGLRDVLGHLQQRDELLAAAQEAATQIRRCDYTPARSTLLRAIARASNEAPPQ